jgi:uncharacterized membrane protein YhhN
VKSEKFNLIFFLLTIVHLFAIEAEFGWLEVSTKPLLVAALMYWFYINTALKNRFAQKVFAALIWSWMGDVLLMMVPVNANFFLFGLGAFLIAQLAYASAFYEDARLKGDRPVWLMPFAIAFFTTYCMLLFGYMAPKLGGLKIPVLLYAIVISIMAIMAWTRYGTAKGRSYWLVALGAGLFVISDSVLAINKFSNPIPNAGIIIMLTYILAQYGITMGAIAQIRDR